MRESMVAICVAGWHFNREFYERVSQLPGVEVFVVSHRPQDEVPSYVYELVGSDHIFCEPNLGYDWGCYQQFLERGVWHNFEYVFFMHDDVVIKEEALIPRCVELLRKHAVVGNGNPMIRKDHANHSPESYAHSSWKPPSRQYEHNVVRGSFFATTRQALERLGNFEVFWDRFQATNGFGNWSLRATCGKWEYMFGSECFGFLSGSYTESDCLIELERGGMGRHRTSVDSKAKRRFLKVIRDTFRFYMLVYWKERWAAMRPIILYLLTPIILTASGRNKMRMEKLRL